MPRTQLPDREANGDLPSYAWPGAYPIMYLDGDNSTLCATCATRSLNDPDEVPQFQPVHYFLHLEGDPAVCDQCGRIVDSAYGEPED